MGILAAPTFKKNMSISKKAKEFAYNLYKDRWPLIQRVLNEMNHDGKFEEISYDDEFANFDSPMNEMLFKLYDNKLKKLYFSLDNNIRIHNALPYLIAASQIYENSTYKIMVAGQESNDWGSEFSNSFNTLDLMRLYDFWINGYGGITYDDRLTYRPIFQFYADYIKYNFEKESEYFQPLDVGTIYYNTLLISKLGKGYDENTNLFSDEIFGDILNIVKPNCILFLIGNDARYREHLKNIFQMDFYNEITTTELLQFYPSGNNNPDIFIAGHPGGQYLNSKKLRKEVATEIQKHIKISLSKIQK